MPTAQELEREHGVCPRTFSVSVARCVFGRVLERGEVVDDDIAEVMREHYLMPSVHHPRLLARRTNQEIRSAAVGRTYRDVQRARREMLAGDSLQTQPTADHAERRPRGRPRGSTNRASIPIVRVGIGADPEFEVITPTGRFIPFRGGITERVGVDGDGMTGELRPQWSNSPLRVATSLDSLLVTVAMRVGANLVGAGGGVHRPLGGHIHISGIGQPSPALLSALDRYVYIPIRSRCRANNRRHNGAYDHPSLYRSQPYGGFEYRSSPSWLAHPVLTRGALVVSAILARSYRSLPDTQEQIAEQAQGEAEQTAVREFYTFLAQMQVEGRFLEDLEVLRAWGKRSAAQVTPEAQVMPTQHFQVRVSSDEHMPTEPIYTPVECRTVFMGARENREDTECMIFLPQSISHLADRISACFPRVHRIILTRVWEVEAIGFSLPLRRNHASMLPDLIRAICAEVSRQ